MEHFVENSNNDKWEKVRLMYPEVLRMKAQKMKPDKKRDLIKLDSWCQDELPEIIQKRKPKHITHEELCKLMKWKLTRGKFRPRLTELAQSNQESDVVNASTEAFQRLPNIPSAIQALSVLKGVGVATASAILAAGAPKAVPFMADESILAIPGLTAIKYDLNFYKEYLGCVTKLVKDLNKQDPEKSWTAHNVEITLWTYYMANTLDPSLLETTDKKRHSDSENTTPVAKKKKKMTE